MPLHCKCYDCAFKEGFALLWYRRPCWTASAKVALLRGCCAVVVQAPMLYCGERVGAGGEPRVDVAVDPLDGTTLTSQARALLSSLGC